MRVPASFHARMLTDKSYGLIWFKVYKGHQFFIFKWGADSKYPWPLFKLTEQEWNTIPGKIRLPPESTSFESKVQRVFVPNGRINLNWQIRVLQKVDTQYDLEINASDGQKQFFWKIPFGYGYCLASMANPNEVFRFTLQCPAEWNTVTSVDIKIKPRTDEWKFKSHRCFILHWVNTPISGPSMILFFDISFHILSIPHDGRRLFI